MHLLPSSFLHGFIVIFLNPIMPNPDRVGVVVFAYNEEDNIAPVLDTCMAAKRRGVVDEVFVLDDASTDNTAIVAKSKGARVISHGRNQGKTAGFFTAKKVLEDEGIPIMCTMDADYKNLSVKMIDAVTSMIVGEPDINMVRMPYDKCEAPYSGFRAVRLSKVKPFLRHLSNLRFGLEIGLENNVVPASRLIFELKHTDGFETDTNALEYEFKLNGWSSLAESLRGGRITSSGDGWRISKRDGEKQVDVGTIHYRKDGGSDIGPNILFDIGRSKIDFSVTVVGDGIRLYGTSILQTEDMGLESRAAGAGAFPLSDIQQDVDVAELIGSDRYHLAERIKELRTQKRISKDDVETIRSARDFPQFPSEELNRLADRLDNLVIRRKRLKKTKI